MWEKNLNKNNQLTIMELNIISLVSISKRKQFQIFLNEENPDIILLCETKVKINHKLTFSGYNIIRNDRQENMGGGTAILIKSCISYTVINVPSLVAKIELTIIKVHLSNNKSLFCVSWYNAPNATSLNCYEIETILNTIDYSNPNVTYIFGGDLNAKNINWLNKLNNINGIRLQNWLEANNHKFHIKMLHTMIPTHEDSFLDFYLVHNKLKIQYSKNHCDRYLKTLTPHISDHNAVQLIIDLTQENGNTLTINYRDPVYCYSYNNAKWDTFKNKINEILINSNVHNFIPNDRNLNTNEIDKAISFISKTILKAVDTTIPKIKLNKPKHVDIPDHIKSLIKEKHKISRQMKNIYIRIGNKDNPQYTQLKSQLKCLTNMTNNAINTYIKIEWETKLHNIKKDFKLFKNINNIVGKKTTNNIPTLQIPANISNINNTNQNSNSTTLNQYIQIGNDKDKADYLANYFKDIHVQNQSIGDKEFTWKIESEVENWLESIACKEKNSENIISKTPITEFMKSNLANTNRTINPFFINTKYLTYIIKTLKNNRTRFNIKYCD